jgi:hypothetical protein
MLDVAKAKAAKPAATVGILLAVCLLATALFTSFQFGAIFSLQVHKRTPDDPYTTESLPDDPFIKESSQTTVVKGISAEDLVVAIPTDDHRLDLIRASRGPRGWRKVGEEFTWKLHLRT